MEIDDGDEILVFEIHIHFARAIRSEKFGRAAERNGGDLTMARVNIGMEGHKGVAVPGDG